MSSTDNFQPIDYVTIACEIENAIKSSTSVNLGNREGAWMRAAISRAYYGVFLVIRDEILKSKYASSISYDSGDHQAVLIILRNVLPSSLRYLANDLFALRTHRNDSDYKMPYFTSPHRFEVNSLILGIVSGTVNGIMNRLSSIKQALGTT